MAQKGIISAEEMTLCKKCVDYTLQAGASASRISLSKSIQNSISILDGQIDKIVYNEDRSIFMHIFADGKYGTFSTNRLEDKKLKEFIGKAVDTVRLMAPDKCRVMPESSRKASGCIEGDELELLDENYFNISQEEKIARAKEASLAVKSSECESAAYYEIESLECEYSDNLDDNYMIDSEGFEAKYTETSFGFCCEATLQDAEGELYSGYHWTSAPKYADFRPENITAEAIAEAAAKISPRAIESGKYRIVVHRKAASRLIGPIIQAVDGNSVQQKLSFLCDSIGKKIFSEHFTLMDLPLTKGCPGSRLFDTEGVATADGPIIENGVVKKYFVNSYCAAKTGLEATVEGVSRPRVEAFICNSAKKEINLEDILADCDNGILITDFNGGNCNQATGAFSFGIEGFRFEKGKILYPIEEALLTGNMIELWNRLRAAGSDQRKCTRWQIPSLAFDEMDINA